MGNEDSIKYLIETKIDVPKSRGFVVREFVYNENYKDANNKVLSLARQLMLLSIGGNNQEIKDILLITIPKHDNDGDFNLLSSNSNMTTLDQDKNEIEQVKLNRSVSFLSNIKIFFRYIFYDKCLPILKLKIISISKTVKFYHIADIKFRNKVVLMDLVMLFDFIKKL